MNLNSKHRTAILVFAHSSQEELKHKKISKGRPLFEALTKHTLKTVKEAETPFFHITEKEQVGLSFGERFSNAIQGIFSLGYEQVITVGNDSPHLTKALIKKAITALNSKRLVLGPSSDGGFYLMGLHKENYEKTSFEKLPWQTSKIREEILDLFSSRDNDCFLLPQLFDIDSFWDIETIAKSSSRLSKKVLRVVTAIICNNEKIEIPITFFANSIYFKTPSNKGSPTRSFS